MKGHWTVSILASILVIGGFGLSQQAFALFVETTITGSGPCDPLFVPPFPDELGTTAPFISGEEDISSSDTTTFSLTCPPTDTGVPNVKVTITNLTPFDFIEVWYVSDDETTISNVDGFVNGEEAFRIDSPASFGGCGINCPLIFESITADGIFESTESWDFIIADYANTGGDPPSALGSVGVPTDPSADGSSGSIIAEHEDEPVGGTLVPIDTTVLLVAGPQTMTPWLIVGIVAAVGIGLAVFTIKRNR